MKAGRCLSLVLLRAANARPHLQTLKHPQNYDKQTLILIGGEIIKGFAVALFIGILVGTYSSIFVASPVVLGLRITREDMRLAKKEGEEAESLP